MPICADFLSRSEMFTTCSKFYFAANFARNPSLTTKAFFSDPYK